MFYVNSVLCSAAFSFVFSMGYAAKNYILGWVKLHIGVAQNLVIHRPGTLTFWGGLLFTVM